MQAPRLTIRIDHLWPLAVLVGIFAFVNTHPIRPHDFWWHMAIGRQTLASGSIPTTDTYSYTALGQPYASYQMFWLPEVALYGLYTLGGPAGVVFAYGLVITAAYALLLFLCWRLARDWRASALAVLFAAALGINDWNVRPQGVTFLLGVLVLWGIEQLRSGAHLGWSLLPAAALAVWVNSHGSFPIGLLLLGAWLAEEVWSALRRRKHHVAQAGLALLASCAACLINPRGVGVVAYVGGMTANPVIRNMIPEWAPPSLGTLGGQLFFAGLALSALAILLARRWPTMTQALTWAGLGLLGALTARGSVWFGLAVAPLLAQSLAAIGAQWSARFPSQAASTPARLSQILNTSIFGLLALLAGISLPWFKSSLPFPPAKAGLISYETPIGAVNYLLENRLPGQVFHTMSFGSYLAWAAQPEYPVFVDSRIELYPLEVWLDYIRVSNAETGWEETLAGYGVQTLLLSKLEHMALITAAQSSADWEAVYEDETVKVFVQTR